MQYNHKKAKGMRPPKGIAGCHRGPVGPAIVAGANHRAAGPQGVSKSGLVLEGGWLTVLRPCGLPSRVFPRLAGWCKANFALHQIFSMGRICRAILMAGLELQISAVHTAYCTLRPVAAGDDRAAQPR